MQKGLLIKQAKVICSASKWNNKVVDILVKKNVIETIAPKLAIAESEGLETIKIKGLHVSQGWLDMRVNTDFFYYDYREDISSMQKAAARGGFTAVVCMPNTSTRVQNESFIKELDEKTKNSLVRIYPTSRIEKLEASNQLAELKIAKDFGSIAITNGVKSIASTSFIANAILYAKTYNLKIMFYCNEPTLSEKGLMNEGVVNIRLGFKGIPTIAESIKVYEIIALSEYYNYPIHLTNISTKESLVLIGQAKKKNIPITCDVNAYNLFYDETVLKNFDTNYKVIPPLREKSTIKAIIKALKNGVVDAVSSNHTPLSVDEKLNEFFSAKFGMTAIETAFSHFLMSTSGVLNLNQIIDCITNNPKAILGILPNKIEEQEQANLTLFNPNEEWEFLKTFSKSSNTPCLGKKFKGRVLGVVNNGKGSIF